MRRLDTQSDRLISFARDALSRTPASPARDALLQGRLDDRERLMATLVERHRPGAAFSL
jgi:hypothetical protein